MNNEYQGNPDQQGNQDQFSNQQGQQDQFGNQQGQQGQYGNQQGQFGNQQGQQGQYGNQQGQFGNQQGQQGQYGNQQQGGILRGPRDMAENQIDQAIDQYANKIPGGSGLTPQAKEAAHNILDGLEKDGENRLGGLGGGLFGGNKGNQ